MKKLDNTKQVARIYVKGKQIYATNETRKAYAFYCKITKNGVNATYTCGLEIR